MANDKSNTIQEDLGSVIIQAAEVIGSKSFIKAHVQITVASDQYKMFSGEINLSRGEDVVQDGSDPVQQAADLLAGTVQIALNNADELRATLRGWRSQYVGDNQNPAPAASNNPLPAGPAPQNRPAAQQSAPPAPQTSDRNKPWEWGVLTFAPKVSELNYGDRFAILADSARLSADGKLIEFWQTGGQYPVVKINARGKVIQDVWAKFFPAYYMPTGQSMVNFAERMYIPFQASTPPAVVQGSGNPFINVIGPAIPANDVPAVTPSQATKLPIPQQVPGFDEI